VDVKERWRIGSWLQANDLTARKRPAFAHRPHLPRVDPPGTRPKHACALAIFRRTAHENDVEGGLALFLPLVRGHLHLRAD
jgi:hypothetical protein